MSARCRTPDRLAARGGPERRGRGAPSAASAPRRRADARATRCAARASGRAARASARCPLVRTAPCAARRLRRDDVVADCGDAPSDPLGRCGPRSARVVARAARP